MFFFKLFGEAWQCGAQKKEGEDEAWSPPVLVTSPLTLRLEEGGEVFLPCFVSRLGSCVPTWQHGDRVLSVGHMLVRRDARLRVTGYHGLVISRVVGADRGVYSCQVDYQGYVQQVQHVLEVLEGPTVVAQPSDGAVAVTVGETVVLRCAASGWPNPVIVWRRAGHQLASGLSLRLEVRRDTGGLYLCQADNGVGRPASRRFTVTVLYSPTVHLSLLTHLTEAGLVSSLTCLVDSSPPATLTWARDGLEVRRVETNTSSVLELLEVRPGEAWLGNYSCTATTETDSQTASVLVTGRPLAPVVTSRSMSRWARQHELSWTCDTVSSLLEYEIAYKNKWSKMSSHQRQTEWRVSVLVSEVPGEPEPQDRWSHSYLVRNLQPSSVYQVEVRARNRHGWSPVSRIHTFFTQTGNDVNRASQDQLLGHTAALISGASLLLGNIRTLLT